MADEQIPHRQAGAEDQAPIWLTNKQVQERYSISHEGVRRLVERGVLTKYRLAGNARTVRFKQSEIEALMHPDDPSEAGDSERQLVA